MEPSKHGSQISRESRAFFKALGKRIARLRVAKSQSQAELANVLGLAEEVVIAIELGERRPPLDSMPKLAAHFRIAVSDLIDTAQLCLSPRMQQHIETLKKLSRADQRFVMRMAEILARRSIADMCRPDAEIKQIAPPPVSDTNG